MPDIPEFLKPSLPGDALEGKPMTLDVLQGPGAGQSYRLTGYSRFMVGRGPGVQLALEGDRKLSRLHFCIEYNPPHARLIDANSKNKTFLNGQQITEAELRDGDEIQAGETVLRVGLPTPDPALSIWPETLESPDHLSGSSVWPQAEEQRNIPGYEIEGELGKGGMGVVYKARRLGESQCVALKTVLPALAPRADAVARFQRETAILGKLHHPHIVGFHDAGMAGNLLYFVMEYVEGTSASHRVKAEGPLSTEQVVELGCQLLDALSHAHEHGFVHRDVKPSNLLLTRQEGREVVKLADFGLARAYQNSALSGLTLLGEAGGTPEFMPPEQVQDFRMVQPEADLYSTAATLYYLATGQQIYERVSSQIELMATILRLEPIPLRVPDPGPPLPEKLGRVIRKALARHPGQRYADARSMREALTKCR